MPYIGLSSFLPHAIILLTWDFMVSMPYIGLSSFLHGKMKGILESNVWGINALYRAVFISTVPSGSPLFTRVPSPIFASNSQNILKISFFRLFFGLVNFSATFLSSHHYIHTTYLSLFKIYYTLFSKILNPSFHKKLPLIFHVIHWQNIQTDWQYFQEEQICKPRPWYNAIHSLC